MSRCLNLARHARQADPTARIHFAGDIRGLGAAWLRRHRFRHLPTKPLSQRIPAHDVPYDWVCVDSYQLDQTALDRLVSGSGRLFCIADFGSLRYDDVDCLLDFTVGAELRPYRAANRLLGPTFFLNKPEFERIRTRNLRRGSSKVSSVGALMVGLNSRARAVKGILDALAPMVPGGKVVAVVDEKTRSSWTPPSPDVKLVGPQAGLEKFYAGQDVVVSGGGLVKYELAYCCIPSMNFAATPMQQVDSRRLDRLGLNTYLGAPTAGSRSWQRKARRLLRSQELREREKTAMRTLFSTDSGRRVAKELVGK